MIRLLTALIAFQIALIPISVQAQKPVGGVILSEKWGKLWECTPNFKIMRNTKQPTTKIKSIYLSAARNEFEPFQLVITPKKELKNIQITPRTLVGSNGAKIDAWNINVRNVEFVNVTQPSDATQSNETYPDPLPEFTKFSAAKGANSPVWITIYVPTTASAGNYSGVIDVAADGIKKVSIPIKVHVWDFELPSVSKLRTAFGCSFDDPVRFQGANTLDEKRKLVELYNLDFWRHRVSPMKPYEFYDVKANIDGRKLKVDFSDFDIAVQKFFPLFNSFIFPDQELKDVSAEDSERFRVDYLRTVAEHIADKGQINKNYFSVSYNPTHDLLDKPDSVKYKDFRDAVEPIHMADSRIKVLVEHPIEKAIAGIVDIWCPSIESYDENMATTRQAAGSEVWWYIESEPRNPYPNYLIDTPAINQRILSWINWYYTVTGILYQQTTKWNTIINTQNSDGFLLYPPVKKPSEKFIAKGPVPSIRWELIREGIEDYDYFYILKNRIAQGKASNKSDAKIAAAQETLNQVDSCAKSRTEYTQDPAKLEAVRVKVAEAIESLK